MGARTVAAVAALLLLTSHSSYIPTLHAGTLQAQLVASDGAEGDLFGNSVDIDGDTIIVGAPRDDIGANANQGSAYIFVRVNGVWTQQQKLVAPDGAANNGFGHLVGVSGNTVVIGAGLRIYAFVRGAGAWAHQQTIAPCADPCGVSDLKLDGDRILVGSSGLGVAVIHERVGTTWSRQATLTPSPFSNPGFGSSVALDGDAAVIGDGSTFQVLSVAHVFVRTGPSSWVRRHRLEELGGIVALSGDTALVTKSNFPENSFTTVLTRVGDSWNSTAILPAGRSLAIQDNVALVGGLSGSVWVAQRHGQSSWQLLRPLEDSMLPPGNTFGGIIALDGGTAVVGLPGKDLAAIDQGAVHVFTDLIQSFAPNWPPPTVSTIPDQTVLVNQVVGPLSFTVGGSIIADALQVRVFTSDPVLVALSNIQLGRVSGAERTVTLRPSDGRIGTATITITVSDGFYSTSTRFLVTVVTALPPPPLPPPPALPGPPRDVVATLSGSGIDLTWREPLTGPVRRYAIAGGLTAGESSLPVQVSRDGALSARIDGLPPTTYSLRVYAIGATGLGPPSNDVPVTMPNQGGPILAPPYGLRVIEQAGRRVTVTWESPVIGVATSTRLDAGLTLDTLAPLTTVAGGPISGDVPVPLWVQVRAQNGSTTSAPSQPLHITFDAPCAAPPAAPILLPTSFMAGLGTFAWLPGEGAMASRYRVEIVPLAGPARAFETFGGSSLVLPVTAGSFSSVRVVAINGCGETVSP